MSPLDRTRAPGPLEPRGYEFPHAEIKSLPNGLNLMVASRGQLPLVSVCLGLRSGASCDPSGREGLSTLTARLLTEGAGSRGAAQHAEEVEQLGASLDSSAGWDLSTVRMGILRNRLEEGLDLFADVVLRPRFEEAEVTREREQRLAELQSDRDDPRMLCVEHGARFVYGTHRYGTLIAGTESGVQGLATDQLRAFHATHYVPGNAFALLVGQLEPEEGFRVLEERFANWQGGPPPLPRLGEPEPLPATRIQLLHKPDAAQSDIRVSHPAAARTDPDYFALTVMNAVLGEAFGSRLYFNLRERHGYTYGASSSFGWRKGPGPFVASASVHTPSTAEAVKEFLFELHRIREEAPSAEEMHDARGYLAGGIAVELQSNGSIAERLAERELYGLPEDYMSTFRDRIYAVSSQEVVAAARRWIHPERLAITIVGDAAAVEAPLRERYEVTVFDQAGSPLR